MKPSHLPNRALVIAPAWIGDAIMSQPLLVRLMEAQPDLELDALASSWITPVLRRMGQIRQVIENPFGHGQLALKQRYRFARTLAGQGYGQAYVLPNSFKSALIPWFAGIPERIGFTGESRYGLINRRHRLDKMALPRMVERFAQLTQNPSSTLHRPLPTLSLSSSVEQQAQALDGLGISRPGKLVVFCPGAEYGPAKRWPVHHFARLAQLLSEHGFSPWLLGSSRDAQTGEDIVNASAVPVLNLCGRTRLDQAIDIIAQAELVVCNDSGLMHVAAALHRPLIAIYGSSSPDFTPPLTDKATIVRLDMPCSPCFKRVCPLGHMNCLNQLEPEYVLETCLAAYSKYGHCRT